MKIHTEYKKDGFEGWFYPVPGSDQCIIILAGSKGNDIANKALAGWINKRGCCALGIGKWQNRNERDGVHEWPLEYFGKALAWLKNRGMRKFGLYGISMGGNMALAAASIYPDFSLIIASEAMDVIMEGFEEGKKDGMTEWCTGTSSYTFQGKPLPYLSYNLKEHEYNDLIQKSSKDRHEISSIELYYHVDKQEIPENCFIPIERIRGRLLIVAAADDSMWESEKYAERMKERLASHTHEADADAVIYPYGTHLLIPYSAGKIGPFDVGSLIIRLFRSGKENAAACRESRKKLEKLLDKEIRNWRRGL